jgi:N-acetylmuramoyl-L-alanine amidase
MRCISSQGGIFDDLPLVKRDLTSKQHLNNPPLSQSGLTVHTTANRDKGANAMMHDKYYDNNSDRVSVHWTVDSKEAILSVPENKAAWHAGNRDYNLTYIGMEICENNVIDNAMDPETYTNAVNLAADILHRHNWGVDKMIQHRDVPGREWKNCPNKELIEWPLFKEDVQKALDRLAPKTLYRVQVGAFSLRENAEIQLKELKKYGFEAMIKEERVK